MPLLIFAVQNNIKVELVQRPKTEILATYYSVTK